MAVVAPAINADDINDFTARVDRVKPFAKRLHIDISDGVFTPHRSPNLAQVYGIDGAQMDLHLMMQDPAAEFENIVSLHPDLVIIHFESNGAAELIDRIKELQIKVGLAVKKETAIEQVKDLLPKVDHLLVFTGNLGFNGGEFDAECLDKIAPARAINDQLEIGVDGGVDNEAARQSVDAGADVLDSGSFIQNSNDPEAAYIQLDAIANGEVT